MLNWIFRIGAWTALGLALGCSKYNGEFDGPVQDDPTGAATQMGTSTLDGSSTTDEDGTPQGEDATDCGTSCASEICGDGIVDATEECDDGNLEDTDACTSACRLASCGDGFVGPGEACDDGNLDDADGCTSGCAPPSCGDGVPGPGEECDDGNESNTDGCLDTCVNATCGDSFVWEGNEECEDGGGGPGDHCQGCVYPHRFVFVTSALYAADLGGIAGADALCQAHADGAGLAGTYYAWLASSENDAPVVRFEQSTVEYQLPDGTAVASGWDDLVDGQLAVPIDQTEEQSSLLGAGCIAGDCAWTSVDATGAFNPDSPQGTCSNPKLPFTNCTCDAWMSADSGPGLAGFPLVTNSVWTNSLAVQCDISMRLYCFQQVP